MSLAPHQILPASPRAIADAARRLVAGEPVALPTETVYGLAARADSAEAVAAVYSVKGRPDFNPLIVHVLNAAAAEQIAVLDKRAKALAAAFWPGPLTMVLPMRTGAGLAAAVTAGLETVALRCPAHPVMRDVLAASGLALAAPSANASGGVSPTTAAHVAASLGQRVGVILDGGACAGGIESTIVALREHRGRPAGWQILRPGQITAEAISAVLGASEVAVPLTGGIEAPGQLASHYAPGKPVRLGAMEAEADEFMIGFGALAGDFTLSASGDLAEAAARLYQALHLAAAAGQRRIAIAPIPEAGIGIAINDRLRRAAA